MDSNLPLDIISEVLLRLPIKSIGRFRCVSKSWLCLTSESLFVKKHFHRSISSNTSYYYDDDDDSTRIAYRNDNKTMLFNPSRLESLDLYGEVVETFKGVDSGLPTHGLEHHHLNAWIVGSCHGLLAVVIYDNHTIFVCNPCTRDFRELPKLDLKNEYVLGGVGYDSSSDDYKILIAENVFSLKSNSWRKTPMRTACDVVHEEGVFFNGTLHWIIRRQTKFGILTFDLETEQYLEPPHLQLPPIPDDNLEYQTLFVMGENLSLFLYGLYQFEHEVWVMKKKGAKSTWAKSFVVHDSCDYYLRPICLLKSGELLIHSDDQELKLHNPKDGTSRLFCIFKELLSYYTRDVLWQVIGYNESLVSPYRGSGQGGH